MNIYPSDKLSEVQELISKYDPNHCYLLFDSNTIEFCDPIVRRLFPELASCQRIIIPAGDQYKTLEKATTIWDFLIENGASRNALLINIGGGMITDIGGFCAANYKRGIDFINIPTSLLGMVDASVGGKTGINFKNVKNQLGAYADAKSVFIHPDFLNTLPRNELHSGLAEMIKHLLLSEEKALEYILKYKTIQDWIGETCIIKNIDFKLSIVKQDYHDTGIRQCLNFGHTMGHAIESLSHVRKTPLLHGEAVILGMIEELKLSENRFGTPVEIRQVLEAVKKKYFPFLNFTYKFEKLVPFLSQDKKNDDSLRFSLLATIAKPKLQVKISMEELRNELA